MGFKNDVKARIPFVVVGVFLIMGSAIISSIIIQLESFESKELIMPSKIENLDKMLTILKSDLADALNTAGMEAMDYAGKHPVMIPNINSKAAQAYDGNLSNYTNRWNDEERHSFNENWIKNMIRKRMNLYIESNYMDDVYNNGEYSINAHYIKNWSEIKIKKIYMRLDRTLLPDSWQQLFVADSEENFPVYWEVSIPLKIDIKNMRTGEILDKKIIEIDSVITSRYPLMEKLTEKFEKCINSKKLSQNKLFILFTLLSQPYTEGRSLLQYGGLYEKIPNIVDNRWICYLINSAILLEEFMLFSSVDPISSIYLLLHWKDLASYGFPEKQEVINLLENDENENARLQDVFQTITNDENKKIEYKRMVNQSKKSKIDIANIAEAILFETNSTYIYYNDSYGTFHNCSCFEGYETEYKGRHYHYVPPPPYCYYNITTGKRIFKDIYFGKTLCENGSTYFIQFGNESYISKNGVMSNEVASEIENKINKSYAANFSISVERKNIGNPYYRPNLTDYWNCKKREGKWILYKARNITPLKNITSLPYIEEWEIEWHKYQIYGHRKPIYEKGNLIGFICEGEKNFTYIRKERVKFIIDARHPKVHHIFNQTNLTLSSNRHDNNLFYMLRDFVKKIFIPFREKMLQTYGEEETKIFIMPDEGKNKYAMEWLRGNDGEVMNALKEILNKIKQDNITIEIGEKKGMNTTVDGVCHQLLQKYRMRMDEYIGEERYISDGMYKSCGALVVAKMREWYVKEIENRIEKAAMELKNRIRDEIDKKLNGKINFNEVEDTINNMPDIDFDSVPIQFGLTMQLENSSLRWKEEIGFSIDQSPDYFSPNNKYFFVSNTCVFGPSGLPLLPTPITPWIITMNLWYIHVEGTFSKFEITDTIGKMRPSILFGGSDFSYVREMGENGKNKAVIDPATGEIIGWNTPISFSIDTINIGIIPPNFFGDKNPSSYPVEKNGNMVIENDWKK